MASMDGVGISVSDGNAIFEKPPYFRFGVRRETTCSICGLKDDCLIIETMAPEFCLACLEDAFAIADKFFSNGPAAPPR